MFLFFFRMRFIVLFMVVIFFNNMYIVYCLMEKKSTKVNQRSDLSVVIATNYGFLIEIFSSINVISGARLSRIESSLVPCALLSSDSQARSLRLGPSQDL